ncbi:unnamed protein product, partial [Ectocarpus sp. 12 AP-2014]
AAAFPSYDDKHAGALLMTAAASKQQQQQQQRQAGGGTASAAVPSFSFSQSSARGIGGSTERPYAETKTVAAPGSTTTSSSGGAVNNLAAPAGLEAAGSRYSSRLFAA